MGHHNTKKADPVVCTFVINCIVRFPWCPCLMFGVVTLLAAGSNPFTTNVVPLSPQNWSKLESSPHVWMVNVCRQS